MTICIAAICENNKEVLLASDRMVTLSFPSTEFEHDISKFIKLTEYCYMGTSGEATRHTDVIRRIRKNLKPNSEKSIYLISEIVKKAYIAERMKRINDQHFLPRGMNIEEFYSNMENYPPDFIDKMDDIVEEYDLEIEVILAGVDKDGGHIFTISNPGVVTCHDDLGYASVGSGDSHSEWVFIYNEYYPLSPKRDALLTLYKAKKRAETAEGVGKKTDIVMIDEKASKEYGPGSPLIEDLDRIYTLSEKKTEIDEEAKKMMSKLRY